jgi:hypothetical protein
MVKTSDSTTGKVRFTVYDAGYGKTGWAGITYFPEAFFKDADEKKKGNTGKLLAQTKTGSVHLNTTYSNTAAQWKYVLSHELGHTLRLGDLSMMNTPCVMHYQVITNPVIGPQKYDYASIAAKY